MAERNTTTSIASALVADDHGVTRFGLAQFLRSKLGVRTLFEAPTFTAALELLTNQQPELAIFDLGIPGLKSPKDLQQVRRAWPDMKVVVLSGSDLRANILAALEAGVHGYIVKTETTEDLAESLGYVLAGGVYVPPCLSEITQRTTRHVDTEDVVPAGGQGPKLTTRQRQVLRAIIKGQSNKQIAKDLKLSVGTIKMHVSAVLTALGAQNRLHAASLGRKLFD